MLQLEPIRSLDTRGKVSDAQLTMERRPENLTVLSISFFQETETVSKPVEFCIRLSDLPAAHLQALRCTKAARKVFTVADIYPLNGIVKDRRFKMTDFVRPIHRTEIQQHGRILDEIDREKEHARCLVIDFKDKNKRYDRSEDISAAEKSFTAFFLGKGYKDAQAEIFNIFKESRINFLINEGSLKANLIGKVFTPEQSEYFQSSEKGPELLCQLCEVIMNGFKQGYEVVVNERRFNPNDYISVINRASVEVEEKARADGASALPSVCLLTMYPAYYKRTYSIESRYYQLITKIFRTRHEDKNDTTIITIDR